MRVVLVANAPFPESAVERLRAATRAADAVIGIDGGARTLVQAGIVPHIVTGDFDSLAEDERAHLAEAGARIVPTPDQEFTDLDKALAFVRDELAARDALVFGATGGRLDHAYSALSALIKHGRWLPLRLVDETAEIFLVPGEIALAGDDLPGRTLSLMAFGPVHGITTTGVRWPLSGESLAPGVRDGTLNEIVAPEVSIRVDAGDLLAMLHHPTER